MFIVGLSFIILGWLIQLFSKGKEIKVPFLISYCIGVGILAYVGLKDGFSTTGIMELGSALSAVAVLIKSARK